jgi:hypothetical protein
MNGKRPPMAGGGGLQQWSAVGCDGFCLAVSSAQSLDGEADDMGGMIAIAPTGV